MKILLALIVVAFISLSLGYKLGYDVYKSNVSTRGYEIYNKKPLNDSIYSQIEVEYIMFGTNK